MTSVRIIQIAESWGGMEHNNTQLAAQLTHRGVRASITTVGARAYSLMPERYRDLFEVEEIDWPLDRLPGFWQWYRLMRARPADIAVLPKNWWAKGGLALVWAAGLAYPRVVLREHVAVPNLPRPAPADGGIRLSRPHLWWWRHLAYGTLLSAVPERIICVSETVRSRLVEQCAFSAAKTVAVHNGVDTDVFRHSATARAVCRAHLGIPAEAVVVGAVGRLEIGSKRHDWSLRAFAEVLGSTPAADLWFLLVGDGPDRARLAELARELGVSERVVLAPFTPAPWEAYSSLDVFLMPSAFEAFGLAMVEAMACERCVIGAAVDGLREILSEPGIGFAVAPEDFQGLVAALRCAIAMNPGERRAMGRAARASVLRRFDAKIQYQKIVDEVLGPTFSPPAPALQRAPVVSVSR